MLFSFALLQSYVISLRIIKPFQCYLNAERININANVVPPQSFRG